MKFKILTLGAGIALAAGAAFAADPPTARDDQRIVIICEAGPGGPDRHPGPGGPGPHGGMHGKLDANNDGSVSREEFRAVHDEMFGKMDKNHDGKLSGDEFPHGPGPGGPGGGRIELRLDGHDGPHDPEGANCRSGAPADVTRMEPAGPGGPGGEEIVIVRRGPGGPGGEDVRIVRHGPGGPGGHDDLDKNNDGKISFEEFTGPMREHFTAADKNHNGFLDEEEMKGDHQFIFRNVERN